MANDELMRLAERVEFVHLGWTDEDRRRERESIAADLRALAQRAPQNGAVPEGWQLVPISPTDEMLQQFKRPPFAGLTLGDRYARLLAAAPAPETLRDWSERMAAVETGQHVSAGSHGIADEPAPEADQYADCCDTPAYCSSVRRCTAKDAAQYVANGLQPPASQPEGVEALASQDEFDAALAEFYRVVCETVERGEPYDYDYTGREEAKAVCGLYAAALRRLASAQRAEAGKDGA